MRLCVLEVVRDASNAMALEQPGHVIVKNEL
jgi:hypothetical protein